MVIKMEVYGDVTIVIKISMIEAMMLQDFLAKIDNKGYDIGPNQQKCLDKLRPMLNETVSRHYPK